MAEDLRRLDRWMLKDSWPLVPCPACPDGHLVPDEIKVEASESTNKIYATRNYPPTVLSGTFHGLLRCAVNSCRETVAVAGDYDVDVDVDDSGDTHVADFVRLRFAVPALKIIRPPPRTPKTVSEAIDSAARIIWADPGAAANRLRFAIDELLTAYGMPRFRNANGKRLRLTTDQRIRQFRRYELSAADALEAVKWIGNQGSHEASLNPTDVLDGADLLNHALKILYDRSQEEMERRIRAVNKRRGLPRSKRA
jgi:hypothetical protein